MGAHSKAPRFRRARSILTVALLAGGALVWAAGPSVAASPCPIPGNFEIDGDMLQATCTPAADDWNTPNIGVQSTTQGGTYQTSGKDDGITTTWSSSGSTPDKTNFERAYATSRVVGGHFYVFVAWERSSTTGTQGYAIEIDNSGTRVANDQFHTPQPDRSSGGAVFYISSQGSSAPTFDSACSFTSQSNYGTTCTSSDASVTSAINTASISDPLAGTTQAAGSFFEVALDVTALTGIVPSCPGASAASVYLRSITGQTHNGNLKGYMAPLSVSPNSTCVAPPMSTTATPGGSVNAIGSTQHDTVTVGTAQAPGVGSVKFFLCGPAAVTANGGDCSANGTQVGGAVTLDANGQGSSANVTGATTPNDLAVGKYCWRSEFTPSANDHHYLAGSETNDQATGAAGDECFVIVRNTTLIGTAASSQTVGAAIHDVATLSGATANAGGTITFKAFGPSDNPDCSGNPVFTSTVNVSGNGNYNSGDFTPDTAGKYYWIASYSGDDNNLGSSGSCGDQGETSTVGKKTTLIGTAASSQIVGNAVHDVASLSGATAGAGGTITFTVYGPSDSPDCSGNPVFTSQVNVSGPGNYQSGDFTASTAGKYYWIASYSGDVNNLPATGSCGDQGETSTIGKKTTLIATAASSETIGSAVHDVATLSGGLNPTGTITFNLYGPSASPDCSGVPVFTSTVNVSGNGDYNSGNFTPSTAGSYYWTASYSGDVNNLPSADACGAQGETSVLVKRTTGIVTAATSATVGSAVHDVATLSGATANAGGTITFNLYGPSANPDCSGNPVFTSQVNVSGNGNYNSGNFTPSTAGTYYWTASYSGDVNNLPSSGSCGDAGETSTLGKQPTGITTTATSGTLGDAVHDVAALSGGLSPTGTITFNLYGPSANPDCSGSPVFTSQVNVSGNGNYNSGNFTPTAAGSYYWIASYSGDVNNQPSTGQCGDSGETSTLAKRPTAIVTAATSGTVGDAVHDVATLSGASAGAGGTITFTLYGPSDTANCSGAPVFTSTVNVSGNGNYNSGNFTPTAAGKYYWIASYSGDSNNLSSSGSCGDQGETSTLAKKPTAIVTAAASATVGGGISDSATLSGGTNDIVGAITFQLWGPSDSPDCSGAPIFTSIVQVTGNGIYSSDSFTPGTAGKYYWIASYSGDSNNLPSTGSCGDQGETSQVGKKTTLIATAASSQTVGAPVHDVATLTGATANAGGTITFKVWGPSDTADCSGAPLFTSTVNVSGPGNYTSDDFTPSTAGLYYWIASYSGDTNNLPSSGSCGDQGETSTIGKRTTLIGTAATSQTVGGAVHDVATLSGATANAGGTITFKLYGPSDLPDCSGAAVFTDSVNVNGPGNYQSGNFTPTTAGSYYWIASYSGDVNNQPSAGNCGDQGETSTINKATPGIVTTATSGTVGDAVHDTATLSGGVGPTGTITFNLYGPSDTPDCSGTPVFTDSVSVSGNGDYVSGDFTPTTAGTYYWIASYSGDVNNEAATGSCGDDGETSTLAKAPTGITTAATSDSIGGAVHDVATLSGATADAGGTITFNLYGPSDTADCTGTPVFTVTVDVAGPGDYASGDFVPDTAGSYYWIAAYSGDANNLASTGSCGDDGETSGLAQQATAITTRATSASSVQVADTATLTGATADATGTITFNLYGPSENPDCTGKPVFTDTVSVSGPGDYTSGGFTPNAFGSYYWTASYSGDVNNLPSDEPCGAPHETSTFESEGSSSGPPPPPPTTPPTHGTSGTGTPVKGELEIVALLVGSGLALLIAGRRRRRARH